MKVHRVVSWGVYGLLGIVFVLTCLSRRPFPAALAVIAVGLVFVWLFKELPNSVRLRKRGELFDEDAEDWPQPVPLGPDLMEEALEEEADFDGPWQIIDPEPEHA